MAENTQPQNIVSDVRLNAPSGSVGLIDKKLVYEFLDTSLAYQNNPEMQIDPELIKKFEETFPGLDVRNKHRPDNPGWYLQRIQNKVKEHEINIANKNDPENEHSTIPEERMGVFNERQKRAAMMMSLVKKVLVDNGIENTQAQEISFNSVNKALEKNPNLVLTSDLDVKNSQNMVESLRPGIEKALKPSPEDAAKAKEEKENKYAGRKDLTEENAKELQLFMAKQMLYQFENYDNSSLHNAAMNDNKEYQRMALKEGGDIKSDTSIELKKNIAAIQQNLNAPKDDRKNPYKIPGKPTPFDDLLAQTRK